MTPGLLLRHELHPRKTDVENLASQLARKAEWIGLKNTHPDLFEKAKKYEKIDQQSGKSFTWQQGESLEEMAARESEILARHEKAMTSQMKESKQTLLHVLEDVLDQDDEEEPCLICHL